MKFKIVNGKVFDPTQNLNGNKIDIYVDNGKIVKPNPSEFYKFKTIYDATGFNSNGWSNRYTFTYCRR